jgi:hypothetical protein
VRNITELTALCNRAGRYHGLLKGRLGTYAIWQKSQETEQCHLKESHKKLCVTSVRQLNDFCCREPERTSRYDQTVRRPQIISPELRLGEVNLDVVKLGKVMSG